ncbi:MAG: hypothetical protein CVV23_06740 [Ignavibacteriae bacterium HGW-Ignavibacteriae-2]|nr:MAG: hypothetical protein CVV23_06740 [Ignavibacteriae bacterium HGW-Ignavibacteriae-2]
MNCDELKIFSDDYLEDLLPNNLRIEFEQNIVNCEEENEYLETCKKIKNHISEMPLTFDPPPQIISDLTDKLMQLSDSAEKVKIEPETLKKIEKRSRKTESKIETFEAPAKKIVKQKKSAISKISMLLVILIVFLAALSYYFIRVFNNSGPWKVTSLNGNISINNNNVKQLNVNQGDRINTEVNSSAKIIIPMEGEISLGKNSSILITETKQTTNSIVFNSGSISFTPISDNPNFEVVYNDLIVNGMNGTFSMQIDSIGQCIIEVEKNKIEVIKKKDRLKLSKNYFCIIQSNNVIMFPFHNKTNEEFRNELYRLSININDIGLLSSVLLKARETDALTLLRILELSMKGNREMIYQKLANFFPPPVKVSREGIINGDVEMLKLWWNDISWQL